MSDDNPSDLVVPDEASLRTAVFLDGDYMPRRYRVYVERRTGTGLCVYENDVDAAATGGSPS
ncbi:MAG: hypothetical protein RIF41_02430, partial [Polyangiaceae bacterium]